MTLWMPKKKPLYAPMLSTFGGGSVRGFQAGGGAAPTQWPPTAPSSTGLFFSWSSSSAETDVYKIDESNDTHSRVLSVTNMYGMDWSADGGYVFTLENDRRLRCYVWNATSGGLGAQIGLTSAVIGSGIFIPTVTVNKTSAANVGKDYIIVTASNNQDYVYSFNGSSFSLAANLNFNGSFRDINWSHDGTKIGKAAYDTTYGTEVIDFNQSTGAVSNKITMNQRSQDFAFSQTAAFKFYRDNNDFGYAPYSGTSSATDGTQISSGYGTGVDCSSEGIVVSSYGWGEFSEAGSGSYTHRSSLPNMPSSDEIVVSASNNVNSNIRYVFSGSYQSTNRLWKIQKTSPYTTTDLGALNPAIGSRNTASIRMSR